MLTSMPLFVCAFWMIMLFLRSLQQRNLAHRVLCVFMLVAMLLYGGHGVYFHRSISAIPLTDSVYTFCNLAVYPLYFIYIEELTESHLRRWHQYLYLSFAILVCLSVAMLYAKMDAEQTRTFIAYYLYHNDSRPLTGIAHAQAVAHNVAKIIFALQIIPVLFVGIRKINRYNRRVRSYCADTEGKTLDPFKHLLILFVATAIVSFVCNAVGRYRFADSTLLLSIPSITFSVLLFLLGYVGYHQRFSIKNLETEIGGNKPSSRNETMKFIGGKPYSFPYDKDNDSPMMKKNVERIVRAIQSEKLFLLPNLKISDIANRLYTNRNYIYHAINMDMGISFSDFINQQRVEYAKQLIRESPNKPFYEIAALSGFSSHVTFYRSFKQFTGYSPSQYKTLIKTMK